MSDKLFLDADDLANRWGCKPGTIYDSEPENLPARFERPASRLVLYPLHEVEAFERAHTQVRDYEAERKLGAKPVFSRLSRSTRRPKGGRS